VNDFQNGKFVDPAISTFTSAIFFKFPHKNKMIMFNTVFSKLMYFYILILRTCNTETM